MDDFEVYQQACYKAAKGRLDVIITPDQVRACKGYTLSQPTSIQEEDDIPRERYWKEKKDIQEELKEESFWRGWGLQITILILFGPLVAACFIALIPAFVLLPIIIPAFFIAKAILYNE